MLYGWNAYALDYDGTLMLLFDLPVLLQLKFSPIITTAITIDRIQVRAF